MKLLKKAVLAIVVVSMALTSLFAMTGCGGSELKKMFNDLGTNFTFYGGSGADEIELDVTEEGFHLHTPGYLHPDPNDGRIRYGDMYYKQLESGDYVRYKRVYRNQISTNEFVTDTITASEYNSIVKNLLQYLLMPIANYEKSYTATDIPEAPTAKVYEGERAVYNVTVSGNAYTYTYTDILISVYEGKVAAVYYSLEISVGGQVTSSGDYEFIRDNADITFPVMN